MLSLIAGRARALLGFFDLALTRRPPFLVRRHRYRGGRQMLEALGPG